MAGFDQVQTCIKSWRALFSKFLSCSSHVFLLPIRILELELKSKHGPGGLEVACSFLSNCFCKCITSQLHASSSRRTGAEQLSTTKMHWNLQKKPPEVALFRGWQNNGKLGAAGSLLTFILHPNSVQPKWLLQLYQKGGHELWHLSKTFLCQLLSHLLQQICIGDL